MPKLTGPKAYSLTGILREQDDQEELAPPEYGIPSSSINEDELQSHYFPPNFLRPIPIEEEENEGNEVDYLNDELDAIWLIPGMVPEPYWDYSMSSGFTTPTLKAILAKAIRAPLKDDEMKTFFRALKIDPEIVFHIGMTPQKLPNIVINNPQAAYELLFCMTHTQ